METKDRTLFLMTLIVVGVAARLLLTDFPNVAPVGALALFAGASFRDKRLALCVPLVVMLISDLLIGRHPTLLYVYAGMVVYVVLGMLAGNGLKPSRLIPASLLGSVAFFLITNFGVFMAYYPTSWAGLIECYTLAIPFFDRTLLSDLAFGAAFFGALAVAELRWPRLRPAVA